MRRLLLFVVLGILAIAVPALHADAELVGRVTDGVTGFGIDSAWVGLDVMPADGSNEFTVVAELFWMFGFGKIPADTYVLSAWHAGYFPNAITNTFLDLSVNTAEIPLSLALGGDGPGFEIFFQVADVGSGVALGRVPVSAYRYIDAVAVAPTSAVRTVTDDNGFAVVRGSVPVIMCFGKRCSGRCQAASLADLCDQQPRRGEQGAHGEFHAEGGPPAGPGRAR